MSPFIYKEEYYMDSPLNDAQAVRILDQTESNYLKINQFGEANFQSLPVTDFITYESGVINVKPSSNVNAWKTDKVYPVPSGKYFIPKSFSFDSTDAAYTGRIAERTLLGALNTTPSTFVSGSVALNSELWTEVWFEVSITTAGGSNSHNIIVYYEDQDGNYSQSPEISITRGSAVLTRYRLLFDNNNFGLKKIFNVVDSSSKTSGQFKIYGYKGICSVVAPSNETGDVIFLPNNYIACVQGRDVVFEHSTTVTNGNSNIRFNLLGNFSTEVKNAI